MARRTELWLFEGILLSLTEHNDISTAPSTYRAVKQKKPTMSWTYPIKRSTIQTKANPIVYFRAFFTCCNKRENESEWMEIKWFVSEWRGSSSIWLWTKKSASYIGWMKIKFGPGRDNVSLPVLFKVLFKVQNTKDLPIWEKMLLSAQKGHKRGRKGRMWWLLSGTSLLKIST